MRTHVALLRGINVGGRSKVAMSDLREITASLGHTEVATYVNSGNVVFGTTKADTGQLAADLEREIESRLGLRPAVVVLSRAELAQVIADNPYPQEESPRCLHAVFRRQELGTGAAEAVTAAEQRARDKGSRDEATIVGRTLFLRTPDGLGRSELAAQLARPATGLMGGDGAGTARNWATVTKLIALLDA